MKLKKYVFPACIASALCLFTFLMISSATNITRPASSAPLRQLPNIIIDAGHGGEDGGAVSGDVLEKTINLSISKDSSALLNFLGFDVRMTREDDGAVSNEGDSIKSRKTNDMKKRLEIFNSSENNVVISIHQNKFSSASSKGAQVFYSKNNDKSLVLADCIMRSVKQLLQPDNERESKAAGNGIYLLKNTTRPAVIVECGFISNTEERRLLQDESYQKQISFAIATGFLDYYNS